MSVFTIIKSIVMSTQAKIQQRAVDKIQQRIKDKKILIVKYDPNFYSLRNAIRNVNFSKMPTDNHPTEKPTNLLRHLIEKSTNKGDLVLDTFAGSFSTARACKEIGRDFICFEVEPEYCRTAKNLLNGVSVSLF